MKRIQKLLLMGVIVATAACMFNTAANAQAQKSLYERLGGYTAVSAVIDDLMNRLIADPQLGRFWAHRGDDGIAREKQLVKTFIAAKAGGPIYYAGRENKQSHRGMRISQQDWDIFIKHLNATLDKFALAPTERNDVLAFIDSTRKDIVEK